MISSWQSPAQLVDCPHRGRQTQAWVLWISEFEVELRVINRTPQPIICTEYLGPDGTWHWIEEMGAIPAAKVWPVEPLIEKGIIKPLEKDVHVYSHNKDQCLRCGYTGQQRHEDRMKGFELHCPGWLYSGGIG